MYDRSTKEKELTNVCILLIIRSGKVMLEPYLSEKLGQVVKALSFKFEKENEADEALKKLNQKYQLTGINNPNEKIKKGKNFKLEGKHFHVYSIEQNGCVQANGKFCFIKIEDLKKEKINVKGSGECVIPEALRMAMN